MNSHATFLVNTGAGESPSVGFAKFHNVHFSPWDESLTLLYTECVKVNDSVKYTALFDVDRELTVPPAPLGNVGFVSLRSNP